MLEMEDGHYIESGEYEVVLDFGSVLPHMELFPVPVEYFIYLLTPPSSPKSYVMKLPPLFEQDDFMGVSNVSVVQPVQWCTYAAHESPSVVVLRVVTEHEYELVAALGRACEWFSSMAPLADKPTNVAQLICSREALLLLDPAGGGMPQWVYGSQHGIPVAPSPPAVFTWINTGHGVATDGAISEYSDGFFTPRDSFRTRFPCWERLHFEHRAMVDVDAVADLVYVSPDESSFNLEEFFGSMPAFLGLNELGQEQVLTDTSSQSLPPPVDSEPTPDESSSDEPDLNSLQVGDWVVYLDPAATSRPNTFVRTRIVGIDRSKRCWVELENKHHETRFGCGPVFLAKFNNEQHQLLTPLQPLSVFH